MQKLLKKVGKKVALFASTAVVALVGLMGSSMTAEASTLYTYKTDLIPSKYSSGTFVEADKVYVSKALYANRLDYYSIPYDPDAVSSGGNGNGVIDSNNGVDEHPNYEYYTIKNTSFKTNDIYEYFVDYKNGFYYNGSFYDYRVYVCVDTPITDANCGVGNVDGAAWFKCQGEWVQKSDGSWVHNNQPSAAGVLRPSFRIAGTSVDNVDDNIAIGLNIVFFPANTVKLETNGEYKGYPAPTTTMYKVNGISSARIAGVLNVLDCDKNEGYILGENITNYADIWLTSESALDYTTDASSANISRSIFSDNGVDYAALIGSKNSNEVGSINTRAYIGFDFRSDAVSNPGLRLDYTLLPQKKSSGTGYEIDGRASAIKSTDNLIKYVIKGDNGIKEYKKIYAPDYSKVVLRDVASISNVAGYTVSASEKLPTTWTSSGSTYEERSEITVKTSGIALTATTIPAYTIQYNGNSNTSGSTASQSYYADSPSSVTALQANGFVKTNWTWRTWSLSSALNSAATDINTVKSLLNANNRTVTVYAMWNPNIKVIVNGGSAKVNNNAVASGAETTNIAYGSNATVTTTANNWYVLDSATVKNRDASSAASTLSNLPATGGTTTVRNASANTFPAEYLVNYRSVPEVFSATKSVKNSAGVDINEKPVAVGNVLTYTLTVKNDTDINRDFVLADTLVNGLELVSGSGADVSGKNLTWKLNISANSSKSISYTVKVTDAALANANSAVTNQFTATPIATPYDGSDLQGVTSNKVINYVIDTTPGEDTFWKFAKNSAGEDIREAIVKSGDVITYEVQVYNPAATAQTVTIVDTVPTGLTNIKASDNGVVSGQTVTWKSVSVPAKSKKKVTLTAKMTDALKGETFENKATWVFDANADVKGEVKVRNFGLDDPTKSVYFTMDEGEDFADMTEINRQIVADGQLITYKIDWMNPTNQTRTVVIEDVLPEGVRPATTTDLGKIERGEDVSKDEMDLAAPILTTKDGVYDVETNKMTWTLTSNGKLGTKAEKDHGYVTVTVLVLDTAEDTYVRNKATLTLQSPSGINDHNPSADSNIVENPVLKTPDKNAVRLDGQDVTDLVVSDGEIITYKVTFKNPADEEKTFIVTDIIPEFTELIQDSISDGGVYDSEANMITWNNIKVAAGAEKTVQFDVKVLEDAQNGAVRNTARIYADLADKKTRDDEPTNIFVLENPNKVVLNADGNDINGIVKREGDILTYNIVFKNPADTERVATVTDELPKNIEFIDATTQGSISVSENSVSESSVSGNGITFVSTEGESSYEYDADSNTVVWTIPTAANCQEMATVRVKILPEAKGSILRNTADVYFPDTTKTTNEVNTPVVENPVKRVYDENAVDINKLFVTPGDYITYSVVIKNPADTDKTGKITDILPAGVDFVEASHNGTYDKKTHMVTWSDLPLGPVGSNTDTIIVTVKVQVNYESSSETIHNEAVYYIDEAIVNSSLEDGGLGGPDVFVSRKYVYDEDNNFVQDAVVCKDTKLTYKISYGNVDNVARNFVIFDVLDDGLTLNTVFDDGMTLDEFVKTTVSGNELVTEEQFETMKNDMIEKSGLKDIKDKTIVIWTKTLEPGETGYVSFDATVNEKAIGNKIVYNHASIVMSTDDGYYLRNTNKVWNPVINNPVKLVFSEDEREITDKMVAADDVITYKIMWKNPSDDVRYATITDALPIEVEFVSADFGGVYDEATHFIKWENVETQANDWGYVNVTVKVKDAAKDRVIQNQAIVNMDLAKLTTRAKTLDSDPENPEPSEKEFTENFVTSKKVFTEDGEKEITDEVVSVGDVLMYRISYMNTSNVTKEFTIKDVLPKGVKYTKASVKPMVSNNTLEWQFAVKAGEAGHIDIYVTVTEDGYGKKLTNTADITEYNPNTDEAPYVVTTKAANNYVFDKNGFVKSVQDKKGKNIDTAVIAANSKIFYHIKVKNPSENAETFTVTDTLDKNVTFVTASDGGVYDKNTRVVTWTITLEPNAVADLSIAVKAKKSVSGVTLKNTAHLESEGIPTDSNTVYNYVMKKPKKSMVIGGKTLKNGSKVTAGTDVTFRVTYNNPTDTEKEITITDKLDSAIVDYVSEISHNGELKNGVITWNISADAGESGEVWFTFTSPDLNGGKVKNKAVVEVDKENIVGDTSATTNIVYYYAYPGDYTGSGNKRTNEKEIVKTGYEDESEAARLLNEMSE